MIFIRSFPHSLYLRPGKLSDLANQDLYSQYRKSDTATSVCYCLRYKSDRELAQRRNQEDDANLGAKSKDSRHPLDSAAALIRGQSRLFTKCDFCGIAFIRSFPHSLYFPPS